MQSLCRAMKISMTSNVLPLHFAPSQASSRQNSNVDSYLQYCEVDSLKRSWSQSSLMILEYDLPDQIGKFASLSSGIQRNTSMWCNKFSFPGVIMGSYWIAWCLVLKRVHHMYFTNSEPTKPEFFPWNFLFVLICSKWVFI